MPNAANPPNDNETLKIAGSKIVLQRPEYQQQRDGGGPPLPAVLHRQRNQAHPPRTGVTSFPR